MYPNPSDGRFMVRLSGIDTENTKISVVSAIGKEVYNAELDSAQKQLNLTELSKGIYFIKVMTRAETYLQRIVIR